MGTCHGSPHGDMRDITGGEPGSVQDAKSPVV